MLRILRCTQRCIGVSDLRCDFVMLGADAVLCDFRLFHFNLKIDVPSVTLSGARIIVDISPRAITITVSGGSGESIAAGLA